MINRAVSALRQWVEDRLPWYDRDAEERSMRKTEAIRQRSIRARVHTERVIADYRAASDQLIREVRK